MKNVNDIDTIIAALTHCAKRTEERGYCNGCPYEGKSPHENGITCPILLDAADALKEAKRHDA